MSILTTRYNRRQEKVSIQCLNKVLNNKTGPLFLELQWCEAFSIILVPHWMEKNITRIISSSSLEPFIFHHLDHHCFALPQLTGSIWLYHLQSGQAASFGGSLKATVESFLLDAGWTVFGLSTFRALWLDDVVYPREVSWEGISSVANHAH